MRASGSSWPRRCLDGHQVVRFLDQLCSRRGRTAVIQSNKGSEFYVMAMLNWGRRPPVLPHVILLPDASPAMLPAGLGLLGFESFMNRKTKRSLTPKASEV